MILDKDCITRVKVNFEMTAGGKEAILPKPLIPVEYTPEYPIPEVLNTWADGSMLVAVRHNWRQYCAGKSKCDGRVMVPVTPMSKGSKARVCERCKEDVTVFGVGAIRLDVALDRRARNGVE